MSTGVVMTVDVGHPPRSAARVEEDLQEAWSSARNTPGVRLLKVIHGYGSRGAGGSTREVVLNWIFRHRARFRGVIEGEQYTLFAEETRAMRLAVGAYADPDLAAGNPGITVIWLR